MEDRKKMRRGDKKKRKGEGGQTGERKGVGDRCVGERSNGTGVWMQVVIREGRLLGKNTSGRKRMRGYNRGEFRLR